MIVYSIREHLSQIHIFSGPVDSPDRIFIGKWGQSFETLLSSSAQYSAGFIVFMTTKYNTLDKHATPNYIIPRSYAAVAGVEAKSIKSFLPLAEAPAPSC